MNYIYFDNNATTKLNEQVKDAMFMLDNIPYNPSSTHNYGRIAKRILEGAREDILSILNISKDWNLIFTSSGTEANNIIINNFKDRLVIISSIEHSSINIPVEIFNHNKIKVNNLGILDLIHLEEVLSTSSEEKFLSVIYANNETGIIQNIKEIASIAKKYNTIVHVDAVQAFGKIDFNILDLNIDALTISAHKCGGPIGAACLIYKNDIALSPFIKGGGQERGMRSGTENIVAIYGFALAAKIANQNLRIYQQFVLLRDYQENSLRNISDSIIIVSKDGPRLANTSMIITPHISNKAQLIAFDLANIALSAGSACSSGKTGISTSLIAIGYSEELANSAIRISLGIENTKDEIDYFINEYKKIYIRSKLN